MIDGIRPAAIVLAPQSQLLFLLLFLSAYQKLNDWPLSKRGLSSDSLAIKRFTWHCAYLHQRFGEVTTEFFRISSHDKR